MGINTKKCSIAAAIAFAISGNAWADAEVERQAVAQSNNVPQQTSEKDAPEKITVTGSRIKRDSFSVATPLVTMDKAAIEDTGLGSLAEILVENMPAINATLSNTTTQSSVTGTGLSTIDLRDLGTDRTLTLIDGRRVVSNSYNGNYVSLSTIPSSMVERVEVITGGASATYGSDAIAGVVNIITEKDKVGTSFSVKSGQSTDGGAEELSFDFDHGSTFANEKGYVFFSSSYDRDFGLSFYDRKRAQVEDSYLYDFDEMCNTMLTADGRECMRDITQADWVSKSDGTLGGVFLENSRNDKQFWYDGQTLRDDWKGNEEIYGLNTQQYVQLKVPQDNLSAAVKVDFEITDETKAYAQVHYSRSETFNLKSPEDDYEGAAVSVLDPETGDPAGFVSPGYIPIDNPYVPQEILDSNPYRDRIYWDRRFAEVGPVSTDNTRETIRTWAGLQGYAFNGEWEWDISVGYGKFHQNQVRLNELDIFKVKEALNAEQLADGTIQCKNPDARADGCVALNLFGEGSITPEMADYIRVNPTLDNYNEQMNAMGYITGDLFELPAGAVSAVFGAEYRKDTQEMKTDAAMKRGGITWNVVPAFKGSVDVREAFAEFSVPLLRDQFAAKNLSADVSARFADYSWSNTGLVQSYKVGLIYEPFDGYMLRANWATAQRAPSITELLSPERGDYDSFDDICEGLTATSTAPGHDACRQEPTIAAQLAENPDFEFEDENSGYSPNVGNDQLKEESATTITYGLTLSPEFLGGVRLAADYYDITVEDVISVLSNERILELCYDSSIPWGGDNTYCNDVSRDSEGQIQKIVQREYNLNELTSRGVDFSAAYKFDLNDFGSLSFKADYTQVIENALTNETSAGIVTDHYAGFGSPDKKGSASLTWRYNDLRVRWSTKYLGEFKMSQSLEEDYQEALLENTEACSNQADSCIANPEALAFQDYGSYVRHDLSVSYKLDLGGSEVRVYGGVNNLANNYGRFTPSGRGNYYSQYGGGRGRFVYLGAQYSF